MIKAIETRYAGHKFRSRLEARWAVFFSTAKIKWSYEPEGFVTPLGWYLPDFFLPDIRGGLWVEVKPPFFEGEELAEKKLSSVVSQTRKDGVIVRDLPQRQADPFSWHDQDTWILGFDPEGSDEVWSDGVYMFCVCPYCHKIGFEFDGRGSRVCKDKACWKLPVKDPENFSSLDHGDKAYSWFHPILEKAYDAARQARFEFGERL